MAFETLLAMDFFTVNMLFAAFCKQNQKRAFWQQQEQMYISMFKQKTNGRLSMLQY